jgi:hypothetical protein
MAVCVRSRIPSASSNRRSIHLEAAQGGPQQQHQLLHSNGQHTALAKEGLAILVSQVGCSHE